MSNETVLLLLGIMSVVSSAGIALTFISQQKLIKERKDSTVRISELEENYQTKLKETNKLHEQELVQLRELYLSHTNQKPASVPIQTNKEVTVQTNKQILDAEKLARGIIAEAQEKSKLMLSQQEKELQKSLVKIVIQVVKRVLNKTLTYEEHRQIIMESFSELK